MFDIHSEEFKYQYQRSKLKVKKWEDQFKAEHGRIPDKVDIKASSPKVRYYYKIYWKLKTMLLEETILGSSATAENVSLGRCKLDNVLKEHTNLIEDKNWGTNKTISRVTSEVFKKNVKTAGTKTDENDSSTWGLHLNKKKSSPLENMKCGLLNQSVSAKLFEGTKFKKRNPRKSVKQTKLNVSVASAEAVNILDSSSTISRSNTSLTSLETFESFQSDISLCSDIQDEFNTSVPCSVENNCSPKIKALIMSETSLSPMLSTGDKRRIIPDHTPVLTQPISLIQKHAADPKTDFQSCRKLDLGWLDRCNEIEKKPSCDSGIESMESSILGSSVEIENRKEEKISEKTLSDDDDIIASSDNEEYVDKLRFLPLKRKADDTSLHLSNDSIVLNTSHINVESNNINIDVANKKIKLDPYQFKPEKSNTEAKEAKIMKKIKQGTLNDNFVRINLKKKVFVRGKKNFNFSTHKKKQWKNLMKNQNLEGDEKCSVMKCYKCGEAGHFARYCQKVMETPLLDDFDDDDEEEEDSKLPTLEEAEAMAREKNTDKKNFLVPIQPEVEEFCSVDPYYGIKDPNELIDTPSEVFEALRKFGHSKFRPGQEQAIMRILCGLSTLVTITTGGGKSLCYQLPAYLYATRSKCITLVVSPLVSLMEDQVSISCPFFKLGCLHTYQTAKQRQNVIDQAKNGILHALLVSPEAVVAGDNSFGLCSTLKSLPPIAFACIDEVHCMSQWSHNFRPSYLMLAKVLKEKLGVKTILGLTATATKSAISSMTRELDIKDENGVLKDMPLPENLCLSVSQDDDKNKALLELLTGPRFKDANAIVIYCTRREDCERLATLIRTIHNNKAKDLANGSKRLSWIAEAYHAGMTAALRKKVQRAFMKGDLRIVVATIAFGMGINKQDIRGVIHYNMPKDFETYVQEVGRAGRDGKLAHCHLFMDKNGNDLNELRRHVNSYVVDRHVLRKLLQRVFVECKCKETGKKCLGHEIAFSCKDTVEALDLPEENIYTLLYYLELHSDRLIKVLPPGFMNCNIRSYRGVKAFTAASKKCPLLGFACALNGLKDDSSLDFNMVNVANALSWDSDTVKNQLKSIEWTQNKEGKWKKSGIIVNFVDLGFRLLSRGDMTPQELDDALDYLIQRVENQVKRASEQLCIIYSALIHFSSSNYEECYADYIKEKSDSIKDVIRKYFDTEELSPEIPLKNLEIQDFDEEEVALDVRSMIFSYGGNLNGRTVARIFHGIQSPNHPASVWYKSRYWRQHLDKDFNKICKVATKEILRLK